MSAHISDDLPLLLTGDAPRDIVLAAAAHLRSCADCQQELVSAVVGHASLMSAQRFAPELLLRDHVDYSGKHVEDTADLRPLPDLSAVFAQAREEAAVTAPRRHRRALLAVAAAIVILAGGGVTLASLGSSSSPARTVSLSAFETGTEPATISISGKTIRVDASQLKRLDRGYVYELWLTDASRRHMRSVGLIGSDNRAELTVSPDVMAKYTDFEVSKQRSDQNEYSGVSVLRGSYR